MLPLFKKHITEQFPFLIGKKLLVAVSGGLDSVVLTHLAAQIPNATIFLGHCNYKLREDDSDLDEQFVIDLGKKLNVKTFTTQFNTTKFAEENKQSIQIAARNLRYNWFQTITKTHQLDYVLTAHHADDNLETALINLTRGTGLDGLIGIPSINKNIVRPLLIFSRETIKNYAINNNISWREDISNQSTKYVRNKIRHKVIPALKEINPNLLSSFAKTSENLQESQQIIKDRVDDIASKIVTKNIDDKTELEINISKLKNLSNPKAYLYAILNDYNFTEWQDVYDLIEAQTGKQVSSKNFTLLKNRNRLILFKKEEIEANNVFIIQKNTSIITEPITLKFNYEVKTITETKSTIYVSKKDLEFPLKIRKWQHGDFFYPKGMTGKKKLSKYFKDEKLSVLEKNQTWLLCDNRNKIIWIIGKRQDNRFYSIKDVKNIIKISFNDN